MNTRYRRKIRRASALARKGDVLGSSRAFVSAFTPPGVSVAGRTGVRKRTTSKVRRRSASKPAQALIPARHAALQRLGTATHERPVPLRSGRTSARSPVPKPPAGVVVRGRHATRFGSRAWRLYVPTVATAARTAGTRLPMVVMLHGCTQNADDFAAGTRMDVAAEAAGCFVLYPEQARETNSQGCWNWFRRAHQTAARGEPAIIASLVAEIARLRPVDSRRVFVAGLSAGGAMAAILGAVFPDRFAAVGVHSGLAAGAASGPRTSIAAMRGRAPRIVRRVLQSDAPGVPTIVFHGDRDRTVHPVNGEQVAAAAQEAQTPTGAGASSIKARTTSRQVKGRESSIRRYRSPDGRLLIERWLVKGLGHAWSGGNAAGSHTDPKGPNATREMLRFFLAVSD